MIVDQKRIDKGLWWDRAWTLTKGCTKIGSGCAHCWAESQTALRAAQAHPPECYADVADPRGMWTGRVEALPQMQDKPLHVRKPTTWAVWNDLFHEAISTRFIFETWCTMIQSSPAHTFVVLTKRHARLRGWCDSLDRLLGPNDLGRALSPSERPQAQKNIIVGISASTQAELDAGIDDLMSAPGPKCLSLEPLLGPIDLGRHAIDWVIVGAESGPRRRECETEWVDDIVMQCRAARVPCFVKQIHEYGRLVRAPAGYPRELAR